MVLSSGSIHILDLTLSDKTPLWTIPGRIMELSSEILLWYWCRTPVGKPSVVIFSWLPTMSIHPNLLLQWLCFGLWKDLREAGGQGGLIQASHDVWAVQTVFTTSIWRSLYYWKRSNRSIHNRLLKINLRHGCDIYLTRTFADSSPFVLRPSRSIYVMSLFIQPIPS